MEEGKMDHSVEYQYTRVDTSTACQHGLRQLLFPYIHNRGWPLTMSHYKLSVSVHVTTRRTTGCTAGCTTGCKVSVCVRGFV